MNRSTIRSAIDPTITERPSGVIRTTLQQVVHDEWRENGQADLVATLCRHPILLRDRSLLMNLAIEDYRVNYSASDASNLEQYCSRFRQFGISVQQSIFRQLEVQIYIDNHPELLREFSVPTWPAVGESIGSFHVLDELGIGSLARVYLCRDLELGGREVVVKTTPLSSPEASILGRLSHPNITPVYSTGFIKDSNLHYLCMPYCGRSTLTDLLDVAFQDGLPRSDDSITVAATRWLPDGKCGPANRWPAVAWGRRSYVDGVLALAIQIADALEDAHRSHILHGDLKPSNVLLAPSTCPMLLDFNLSQDWRNPLGLRGGTLLYMPPEYLQIIAGHSEESDNKAFDPRPDIYSFGVLLYELLTGTNPVTLPNTIKDAATAAQVLLDRLTNATSPIRDINRCVSHRLDSLILRCLARIPNDRPSSMSEVKRHLKAESHSFAAVTRLARVRPALFAAVVGIPLTLFGGTVLHFLYRNPPYQTYYEQGLIMETAGQFSEAIDDFSHAVHVNPSFVPAKFQLARARMSAGEVELAIDGFRHLVKQNNNVHCMAYIGYCFNLKNLPAAAIPWYERVLANGGVSAAVYNNLGASYTDAPLRLFRNDQLDLAERCLHKASEMDKTSITVRINTVRHAIAKAHSEPNYNPWVVRRDASAILTAAPNDPVVQSLVAEWYGFVLERASPGGKSFTQADDTTQSEEKQETFLFEQTYRAVGPRSQRKSGSDSAASRNAEKQDRSSLVRKYYIEPSAE